MPAIRPAALASLIQRASVPPRQLRALAPTVEELEHAVAAALAAPDHGGLQPWRFLAIAGEGRAGLGDLLAESLRHRDPAAPEERLALERARP